MLVKLAPYLPNVTSTEILDNLKKLIKTFLLCLVELFIFIDFLKSGVSKCVSCFYFFLRLSGCLPEFSHGNNSMAFPDIRIYVRSFTPKYCATLHLFCSTHRNIIREL